MGAVFIYLCRLKKKKKRLDQNIWKPTIIICNFQFHVFHILKDSCILVYSFKEKRRRFKRSSIISPQTFIFNSNLFNILSN